MSSTCINRRFPTIEDFPRAGLTTTTVVGRDRKVSFRRAELDARFPGLVDALYAGAQLESLRERP